MRSQTGQIADPFHHHQAADMLAAQTGFECNPVH